MSLISAVQTYLKNYTDLTGKPVWVNYLGESAPEFSVVPLPGAGIVAHYISGATRRVYPFALQSKQTTHAEAERLDNSEFFEEFAAWLEQQTEAGIFPTLSAGQAATAIEVTGGGVMYEQGQSGTAFYQIECRLVYEQAPVTAPEGD